MLKYPWGRGGGGGEILSLSVGWVFFPSTYNFPQARNTKKMFHYIFNDKFLQNYYCFFLIK